MRPDSRAVHAGREPRAREPLAPPIVQAAVHVFDDLDDYTAVASGRSPGHVYGRNSNENTSMLANAVAELEGAEAGVACASGMAAILAATLALAPRPAPLVVTSEAYGVTLAMLRSDLAPLGYEVREVDLNDPDALAGALPGAALVHAETITNPLCRLTDLEAVCRLAAGHGVPVVVDNTFASPVLCRPLELGASLVVHSATKYLGGHSDLVAGVIAGGAEPVRLARDRVVRMGGSLGPFEAWLALRGLRTLHLRMRRHSDNALALAHRLAGLPEVTAVHYPLLEGSASEPLARRLLPDGAGGMLAFDLAGGREAVQAMLSGFRMVSRRARCASPRVWRTLTTSSRTSHDRSAVVGEPVHRGPARRGGPLRGGARLRRAGALAQPGRPRRRPADRQGGPEHPGP